MAVEKDLNERRHEQDARASFGKFKKNYKTVVNDFVWGTAGNLGANSFGKEHLLFQTVGTGVTVVPTTGLRIIINSQIEKK